VQLGDKQQKFTSELEKTSLEKEKKIQNLEIILTEN